MRITVLKACSTAGREFKVGETCDVPDELGTALVELGNAEAAPAADAPASKARHRTNNPPE